MRESAGRRFLFATLLALAAGALVAFWNPVDHLKADLRADTDGIRLSLELAAHAIETRA
ncbi:MAG TPA: hypothetical protein VM662_05680 [Sphingomonas sp.]|nr:hypothetical protein [Sphingomonas sp.]